jgi:toxin ParE1/3/4
MASIRFTAAAETDIVDILAWSEQRFGPAARRRYGWLIETALRDIAIEPLRPETAARPELGDGVRAWHLRICRERARTTDGVVQRPRHIVVYRLERLGVVAVARVLHDAMELGRHLPPEAWD